LASAAFLFLLLRLFAFSGHEWHTAFAVLHAIDLNDGISIVLGTVMANSVVSAAFIAVLAPVALIRPSKSDGPSRNRRTASWTAWTSRHPTSSARCC
jgi:hypothetical protein